MPPRASARCGRRTSSGSSSRGGSTPTATLGIRKCFESPYRPGEKLTVDDFYGWIFEHSVPGLPAAAAKEGLSPLAYMRQHGAFLVEDGVYRTHEATLGPATLEGTAVDPRTGVITKAGAAVGVEIDGRAYVGFPTPSRKLELYSKTLRDWKWPEYALPGLHPEPRPLVRHRPLEERVRPAADLPAADPDPHALRQREVALRDLPHEPPVAPSQGRRAPRRWRTNDLLKVRHGDRLVRGQGVGHGSASARASSPARTTSAAGVSARSAAATGGRRRSCNWNGRARASGGCVPLHGIRPFASDDPDSQRVFWEDAGVHQNLTFPVQPDPVSGHALLAPEGPRRARRARTTATATSSSTRRRPMRSTAAGSR